jgi:alkylation response protein AidB-like acyl-CoA dehydrogenase
MAELNLMLRDLPEEHELKKRTAITNIEVAALSQMETDMQAKVASGKNPGAGSSLMKMMASSLGQQIATLLMEAKANYSIPHNNRLLLEGKETIGKEQGQTIIASYLNARASSIFGGAREVQKNIIAKSVLGL